MYLAPFSSNKPTSKQDLDGICILFLCIWLCHRHLKWYISNAGLRQNSKWSFTEHCWSSHDNGNKDGVATSTSLQRGVLAMIIYSVVAVQMATCYSRRYGFVWRYETALLPIIWYCLFCRWYMPEIQLYINNCDQLLFINVLEITRTTCKCMKWVGRATQLYVLCSDSNL